MTYIKVYYSPDNHCTGEMKFAEEFYASGECTRKYYPEATVIESFDLEGGEEFNNKTLWTKS